MRFLPFSALGLIVFACGDDPSVAPSADGGLDGGVARDSAVIDAASSGPPPSAMPPLEPLFLFVGSNDGKIRVFDVDEDSGALTLKKESAAGANPSYLAFDPPRHRVVAVDEGNGNGPIRSFAFDSATGALTEIDNKPTGGTGTTHLSLDPSGAWVVAANYNGNNMSVLPLAADGMLGAATDTKASGAMSHWAGFDSSGTHVFVPALGANHVAQYTFDPKTGKLTDNGVGTVPDGAGPRHLALDPNGAHAWVVNEVGISVTTFDLANGKLTEKDTVSALPEGQDKTEVTGAEIAVHPSGKHLYASTRGFDSIAHFTVDEASGALTLVANAPTGGHRPRCFTLSQEGKLLYAGNQDADQIVGFKVLESGALEALPGPPLDVHNPTFVGLMRMP